jgi:tetratricopeptide (TPR) repeat protein
MRRRGAWFRLAVLFLTLASGAHAQTSATELLLNKARLLEARGRIDLAAQSWQQILASEPDQQEALGGMARSAKAAGHEEEARGYLNHLKRVNPRSPFIAPIENTAPANQQGRLAEAAKLARAQKYEEAMAIYRDVFGAAPPADWAVPYYETDASLPGGWERATAGLRGLVTRYPESQAYRLSLGKLLTYRPPTRVAGMEMLESVKGGGSEIEARSGWRLALTWENGSRASLASLRNYVARYPEPEMDAMLQRAEKAGTGMSAAEGKELETAYAALKANHLPEAEAGFQRILKTSPHEGSALAGLGYVQAKNRDFSGALASFEEAKAHMTPTKDLNDAITSARFWLYMKDAASALKEGKSEDAAALFQKALALRPLDQTALEGYAGALMQRGDVAAATPVLESLLRTEPGNAEAWRTLINARYQGSGAKAAAATVRTMPLAVAAKLNRDLSYLIVLVSIYGDAGDAVESRRAFRQAEALTDTERDIPEAMQLQLGGLYLRYGEASTAAAIYQHVVDTTPENLDAWEGLMLSLDRLKDYRRALRAIEQLPATLRPDALARPGFLRAVASLQRGMGNLGSAEGLLRKALDTESAGGATPSFYTQLQLAQVWLEQGQRDRAIRMFGELVKNYPDNPESWKGLLTGLHQDKRDPEALDVSARIPAAIAQSLRDDAGYLSLLASVYSGNGQNGEALRLVRQAAARYQGGGETLPAELSIQLAWLLLDDDASRNELYGLIQDLRERTELTSSQRQTVTEILSTWVLRSFVVARTAGDPDRARAILEAGMRAVPSDQRIRRSLAGELLAQGDPHRALALYKNAGLKDASSADYEAAIGAALAERETPIAAAWLAEGLKKYPADPELLNMAGRQSAAKGDFKTAQAYFRRALLAAQAEERTRAVADLRNARGAGDSSTGIDELGTLLLGGSAVPPKAPSAVPDGARSGRKDSMEWLNQPAGAADPADSPNGKLPLFLRNTAPKHTTKLQGPTPVSIPSAAAEPEHIPIDAEPQAVEAGSLLAVATGRSQDGGWITEPKRPAIPIAVEAPEEPVFPAAGDVAQRGTPASAPDVHGLEGSPQTRAVEAPEEPVFPAARDVAQRGTLASLTSSQKGLPASGVHALLAALPQTGNTPEAGAKSSDPGGDPLIDLLQGQASAGAITTAGVEVEKSRQIEEEIKALDDRNTPYVGMGGVFQSRSGQPGFDKTTMQETDLEASTVVGDRLRVGLVMRGIFLDSPAPDGTGALRFGLLPVGSTFAAQSLSGMGAEAQLSTTNFGISLGSTPQAFLVRNWIGGLRFRPAGGPITIRFDRDSLKDTVLSYAGARDPLTGIKWGGVVANTGTLSGNWGNEKAGAYFSVGFEYITGTNVVSNQRIDGTLGAYWRLAATSAGSLTAGLNLFAMHYTDNLRYFTYGQGGYFSPQRFVLFNVPISWTGSWKSLQYTASTSIGSQSFSENSEAFFPTSASLQGASGSYYPAYSNSGVNYNVDFKLAYQVSPNWCLIGFFNANNANFYRLNAVGITIRYSLKSRPLNPQFTVPSLPDWAGKQPFGIR